MLTLLAAFFVAACGPMTSPQPSAQATPGGTPAAPLATSPAASPAVSPDATTTVRAYFMLGSHTDDSGLVPVLRDVAQTQAVGAAAMTALLSGPNADELGADPAMYTWIPAGARFLGLTIDAGIATVNLSAAFGTGSGDAAIGSYAQVVYTLTQFPTVTGVAFQLDGVGVGVPGVITIRPAVRGDFTQFLPPIWVDRPAWGGTLDNLARVTGLANVFEGRFQVEILDAAGHSLTDEPVTASCGTGCWGTFDVTLPYTVATAQAGTLRVYATSAQDGSRVDIVEYPVLLTP
jgi:hypothetical protein